MQVEIKYDCSTYNLTCLHSIQLATHPGVQSVNKNTSIMKFSSHILLWHKKIPTTLSFLKSDINKKVYKLELCSYMVTLGHMIPPINSAIGQN